MNSAGEDTGCLKCLQPVKRLFANPAIHPEKPIVLKHSEFVKINSNVIRVIHVKPENVVSPVKSVQLEAAEKRHSVNRHSLTEEYWFTRWNKPLKGNTCNCSFRRSQPLMKLSEEFNGIQLNDILHEEPLTKIRNVETFVERLIQDTIFEAFQEYCVERDREQSNKQNESADAKRDTGCDNLAFLDDVDSVVLRNNKPAVLETKCEAATSINNNIKRNCSHKTKPLVLLLHGIGSTADVWWNIINSLSSRGFEVIAPDMLGHGYSSAPNKRRAYRFKKLLAHTAAVFDYFAKLDENRKFVIIGHSFGCSLATALSRYRSQQIVQLVLISGGGPTALSAPVGNNEVSVFGCLQMLISPLLFCGLKRSLFYSSRGKHFKPCDSDSSIPKYVLDYINKGQNWPEGDAAFHRRILIPTLLVHGLKDTDVTLVQECEMERTIPRAFLELIPTAGHMSILETPEHLSHMILCFVDWWSR